MRPGPVKNIRYTGKGIYYYENKNNPDQSVFMAILAWDPPDGKINTHVCIFLTQTLAVDSHFNNFQVV